MEIVKAEQYGIDGAKETELLGNLPQIKGERNTLIEQYDIIAKLNIEDPETAKKARSLRLLIRNNRTKGINLWHKTTKDFFLQGGKFVDAIKRKEVAINERMEEGLENIEKYAENLKKQQIELLQSERTLLCIDCSEFIPEGLNFGEMTETDFNNLLNGAKLQLSAKLEAEEKAENKRIEAEKAEADRIEAQRIENEKLKAEKIELERIAEIERKKQAEILAKQKAIAYEKLQKEREIAQKEAKRLAVIAKDIQDKKDAQIAEMIEEKAKIEAEAKEKAKQETERLAKIEADRIENENELKKHKLITPELRNAVCTVNFQLFESEDLQELGYLADEEGNDLNIQVEVLLLEALKARRDV